MQVAVVDVGAAVSAAHRVEGEGAGDAVAGGDLLLTLFDLDGVNSSGPAQSAQMLNLGLKIRSKERLIIIIHTFT